MSKILQTALCAAVILCLFAGDSDGAGRKKQTRKRALPVEKTSVKGASVEKNTTVNTANAGVFSKKSVKSEQVTEVLLGDEFVVTREEGEWAYGHIPSQKGYSGWIRTTNLSFFLTSSPFADKSLVHIRTTRTRIAFRDGSSLDIYAGTRLPLLKKRGDTYEVVLPDGTIGFIPSDAALIEDDFFGKAVRPEDIAETARFFNSSYKWGGITAGGMDCSGFVYTVFRSHGIYLKRDSYQQAEEGTDVPFEDLRTGDLVFFKQPQGKQITHVGIYIGQGNFIHASKQVKGVNISSLSEEFYRKRLAAARRILRGV